MPAESLRNAVVHEVASMRTEREARHRRAELLHVSTSLLAGILASSATLPYERGEILAHTVNMAEDLIAEVNARG